MVDWVHCNICYKQVGQHQKFAISNCGHIYCSECISKAPNQCRICKKQVTFVELSRQMSPEYEIYFVSPVELAQRHLNELKRVIDFQNRNRLQLIKHIKQKAEAASKISVDEYNQIKHSLRKMESEVQDLEEKYRATMNENSHLKALVESKSSTRNNLTPGASKIPSSFMLNTPTSQTPPNERRLCSGFKKDDVNPPQVISPSRISARQSPIDGRIGITSGRFNMGNSSYGITPRPVPTSTSRFSYPSMVTPPLNQNAASPMEFSTPNSQFNRFGSVSREKPIIPRRLITVNSLKKI